MGDTQKINEVVLVGNLRTSTTKERGMFMEQYNVDRQSCAAAAAE